MKEVIEAFDKYLLKKKLSFSAVVIGGAALQVMGKVERVTEDVDCLFPTIPEEIKLASREFAKSFSKEAGYPLIAEWLNNGPMDLLRDLPKNWKEKILPLYEGKALKLQTLGRSDFLKTKLFAYCDRQQDCLALKPSRTELKQCLRWVSIRDANPLWPEHVKKSFTLLAEKLGYGSLL